MCLLIALVYEVAGHTLALVCIQLIISAWLLLEFLVHSASSHSPLFWPIFYMYTWFWTENWFFVLLHNYLFSALIVHSILNATVGNLESCINKILVMYCFGSLQDQTIAGCSLNHITVIAHYPSKSGASQLGQKTAWLFYPLQMAHFVLWF